ncbi:MAG: (d)CMP kinase [Bacillota bacterium]
MKKFAIAIDGPAGSGKSTVAKMIAKELNIAYVDTGAMYRSIAYYAMHHAIPLEQEEAVVTSLPEIRLELIPEKSGQRVVLNGEDVTEKIRLQEIGRGASVVAKYEKVRELLGGMQQEMATAFSLVMDGRDIGTHILPNAEVKVYLDADVMERAKRRFLELQEKGESGELSEIAKEIQARDDEDRNRKLNPLCQAEDAVYIDSTQFSIEKVKEKILELVKESV